MTSTEAQARQTLQRTRWRVDQRLDEIGKLLEVLREEIEAERGERGRGPGRGD